MGVLGRRNAAGKFENQSPGAKKQQHFNPLALLLNSQAEKRWEGKAKCR